MAPSDDAAGAAAGELLYLRGLAVHTSEAALRALLARDGELLGEAAAALWRELRDSIHEEAGVECAHIRRGL